MRAVAGFLCGAWLLLGVTPEDSAADVQLFSCGFEADFCGMTQRTDDHFDWTRHSGDTETGETGPASAYSGSFYIYIEVTNAPSGYIAEVETGSLQHSGTACVTFAYHVYGEGVGFLNVRSTSAGNIWRAYANQGDHWRLGTAEVDLWPEDQVSFGAETSSDSRGDIALDDIVIREGGCRTTEPLPFSCSFEKGFCGMLQRYDDHFDWTRFDRSTDTGPQEAADGTWFIYIETEHPRLSGDVAKIETPSIDFTGHVCVRFKYYMSGLYVGVLRVHLVNVGTEKSIFRLGGDQGSEWQAAEINVTEIHNGDWLRLTGKRGLEPRDIGVDDVLISPGLCNGCQVNNGGCDHICAGSGMCSCRQGYTLNGTNTCVDLNECTGSTHGCSDGCQNTPGSYRCTCPDGKLLDVDGVSCSACPGFYGVNCARPCHCADQARCDPGTGVCPGGLCSPGWSGVACDQACPSFYGVNCSRPCYCADQAPCDPVTGVCPGGLCSPGWSGVACDQDIDECREGNDGCSDQCLNTVGSYHCQCPTGYSLAADNRTCEDVDECLANKTCQHRCLNTVGAYSCGCDNGYILTDDQHRCKGCKKAYDKIVDADETFESTCPTLELLYNTPRDKCLLEACRRGVEVVSVRHEVCDLKACDNGNVHPVASAGSLGWDIFVLNLTWSESLGDQDYSDVPLWQVILAVIVVVIAVIAFAVGIVFYLKRRRKVSQTKEPARVYYENDAALPTRPAGDVTKPADEAPYEEVSGPFSITASAVQIQMSPSRPDPEDPNSGGYEDLESYQPHIRGPYDVIL